jgi:hypothetical protein
MIFTASANSDAKERFTITGVFPKVDTGDGFRHKLPGCFFPCLSYHRVDDAFIRLQVARWLIEYSFTLYELFDHEEFMVMLDDGSDCGVWFPDHDVISSGVF